MRRFEGAVFRFPHGARMPLEITQNNLQDPEYLPAGHALYEAELAGQ